MEATTSTRIAWSLWASSVSLAVADLALAFLNRGASSADSVGVPGQMAILGVMTTTVGALVASRLPRNAVGWLFCALGLGLVVSILSQDYAIRALVSAPGSLPAGELMAWLGSWLPAAGGVATFVMLVFPTGRLPSRRWRPVAWAAILDSLALAVAAAWLTAPPGPEDLHGFNGPESFGEGLLAALLGVSFLLGVLTALAAAIAVLLRLKRARGDERQQLKWFVYAATVLALVVLIPNLPMAVVPSYLIRWTNVIVLLAFGGIPLAAGLAILKYHLYDIDLIINRTLVYGTLTAVLGLIYYGIVIVLQQFISQRIAASEAVVAGSTLVVAALFVPARKHIQEAVDRRFDRKKYDARKTIEAFSARLRDEVDIDSLTQHLLEVITETMQPRHAALWLKSKPNRQSTLAPTPSLVRETEERGRSDHLGEA